MQERESSQKIKIKKNYSEIIKTKSKKTCASKREIMRVVAFRLEDQIKVAKKYEFRNWGQSAGIRRVKRGSV